MPDKVAEIRTKSSQIMEIMKALTQDENLESMVEGSEFLILQYGDEACAPCLTLRMRIENWLKEHTGIEGRYIPICDYSEIAAQRGILSVPTVEVYASGKLMPRQSGYFSLEQIFEQMERYLRIKGESDGFSDNVL